jgi:KDO2-lipid IV(A) lauroyltransferase
MTGLDLFYLFYLYPLRALARVLPPVAFLRATRPLVGLAGRGRGGARALVAGRMRRALPELSEAEARSLARAAVDRFTARALEDLVARRLVEGGGLPEPRVEGLEHMHEALGQGRGVLLFSGHFFAVRLGRIYLAHSGLPSLGARSAKVPSDRAVGRLGRRYLQPAYQRFLHGVIGDEVFVQDRDLSLRILRRLREGGAVYSHLDARFARETVLLPFLSGEDRFPTGLVEIARLTGAPLVPLRCDGDWWRLRIRFGEPVALEPHADRRTFVADNVARLVAVLEGFVCEHPSEWEGWLLR